MSSSQTADPLSPGALTDDSGETGLPGAQTEAAGGAARVLAAVGFESGLVAFGVTAAAFSMWARLEDPSVWGHDEFFATVGLGAFLAFLGCVERWFGIYGQRPRFIETPSSARDVQRR